MGRPSIKPKQFSCLCVAAGCLLATICLALLGRVFLLHLHLMNPTRRNVTHRRALPGHFVCIISQSLGARAVLMSKAAAAVESGFELQHFWAPIGSWLLTPSFTQTPPRKWHPCLASSAKKDKPGSEEKSPTWFRCRGYAR
ncbi:hypothetical protein V8C40DRAFT_60368 [Trichoderma camerunense]